MQRSVTQRDGRNAPLIMLVIFAAFLVTCAFGGGASRVDVASQPFVQSAAIIVLGLIATIAGRSVIDNVRPLIYFGLCCVAIVIAQLIPLPFQWWSAFPGHAVYAKAIEIAGIVPSPRPMTLTPDLTIAALLSLLPPIAAVAALASLGSRGRVPVLIALGAIILVGALMGLLQLATGSDSPFRLYAINSTDAAIGLFANRNHHAMLMALGIPVVAILACQLADWRVDRRIVIAFSALCALLLFASVLVAGSRGGIVLTFFALPLAWMLGRTGLGQSPRSSRRTRRVSAGWYVTIAVSGVIGAVVMLTRTASITRLFGSDPLGEQRITGIATMIKMARDFMPFGSGFGSFASVYRTYEPVGELSLVYLNQAHNDLVQLLIEGGIPALVALFVLIGWWVGRIKYLWLGSVADDMRRRTERLGTVIMGMLLLGSVMDYPLRTPLMAVIFALAAVMAAGSKPNRPLTSVDAALP